MKPLSQQASRRVDEWAIERYGMSGLVLMENAGRNAAHSLARLVDDIHVPLILCGTGNNGGDGFVIARHWENIRGTKPDVLVVTDKPSTQECRFSDDASANLHILLQAGFDIQTVGQNAARHFERISRGSVIVDAMLGTGAAGPLREPFAEAVRQANKSSALRIAIDLPTGLDADTGVAQSTCFIADYTLTFVAPKIGFFAQDGPRVIGVLEIIDIGIPRKLFHEVAAVAS